MKYHNSSRSDHGTVIINIWQPFKFTVSNSAPITHFSKHSEDPPWHNGRNRTDIAEFGPIPTQFWYTMAQPFREVATMNPNFIVIGQKSARSSPLCPITALPVSIAFVELGFLSRIGRNKFERLLIVFGHWTMTAGLRPQRIVEIVHFHNLPTPDLSRHRKFERFVIVFGPWTVTVCDISHI